MLALLQRVTDASVTVDQEEIARIGRGLLVLVGVERADEESNAVKLCRKLLDYRVFDDEQGKMNLSLKHIEGELLLVSQFTLPADTKKGLRPSFSTAAPPDVGRLLFDRLVAEATQSFSRVQTGRFGANMQVSLVNDGPVTFLLQC